MHACMQSHASIYSYVANSVLEKPDCMQTDLESQILEASCIKQHIKSLTMSYKAAACSYTIDSCWQSDQVASRLTI